jgi:Protein of unknown function (DUF2510)
VSAPSPPPGWYPDPDGAPGTARWWNGVSWSDVTTPAGPGVAVGTMPSAPAEHPSDPPAELLTADGTEPGGRRTPWAIGLGLLVLLVVVVTAVLVGGSGDDGPADTAAPSAPSAAPGPSAPAPFPPGTVRIVDEASGISYPHLGNGWFEYDLSSKIETLSVAGQYFVTQPDPPSGGVYLAECTSGPVADGFGWTGPESLRETALAVAASERANYYPFPNEQRVLRDEPRTVDGRAAHLYEFQLSWDVEGYDASGERAAVLLVDVGRPTPALLFLSIPNTHAELYGVIDRVVEGTEVL